jgi:hypothetical protein
MKTLPNNKRRIAVWFSDGWRIVQAMRVHIPKPGWNRAEIYSYRRGDIVFVCDAPTGQNCSCGASINRAVAQFLIAVDGVSKAKFDAHMAFHAKSCNYPNRPKV